MHDRVRNVYVQRVRAKRRYRKVKKIVLIRQGSNKRVGKRVENEKFGIEID